MYFKIKDSAIKKYQNLLNAYPNLFDLYTDESGLYYILHLGVFYIEKADCEVVKKITPELLAKTFARR